MYWWMTGRRVLGGVFLGGTTGPDNGLLIWTMGLMEGMVVWKHLKKTSIDFVFLINKKERKKKKKNKIFVMDHLDILIRFWL